MISVQGEGDEADHSATRLGLDRVRLEQVVMGPICHRQAEAEDFA